MPRFGLLPLLMYNADAVLKIALLEWSDAVYDLVTVSIHTYERAPQLVRFLLFCFLLSIGSRDSLACT